MSNINEFWSKNKEKIYIVAIGVGVVAIGILAFKYKNKCKIIASQSKRISELEIKCVKLETKCLDKDNFAKNLFSNLLRQGNSEGGRQMAYRKQYLKGLKNVA